MRYLAQRGRRLAVVRVVRGEIGSGGDGRGLRVGGARRRARPRPRPSAASRRGCPTKARATAPRVGPKLVEDDGRFGWGVNRCPPKVQTERHRH